MRSIKKLIYLVILILVLTGIGTLVYFLENNKQPESISLNDSLGELVDYDTFSTKVPNGWVLMEDPQNFLAVVIKPANASSTDYYTYYAVNNTSLEQKNLEEYVNALKDILVADNSNIEFTDQYSKEINGKNSIYLELESESLGQDYKTLLVFIADGDWVWVLSFNTPLNSWEEDKTTFDYILQNFQIK